MQAFTIEVDGEHLPISFSVNCWAEFELLTGKNFWNTFYDVKKKKGEDAIGLKFLDKISMADNRALTFTAFVAGAKETGRECKVTLEKVGLMMGDPKYIRKFEEIKLEQSFGDEEEKKSPVKEMKSLSVGA